MRKSITIFVLERKGLWGFKNFMDRKYGFSLYQMMSEPKNLLKYNNNSVNPKGYDQYFLSDHVWPLAKLNATIHDSYLVNSTSNDTSLYNIISKMKVIKARYITITRSGK